MRIVLPDVPRVVIDAQIAAARYPGHEPARWALPLLAQLDALSVRWQLVELEEEELAGLWLPVHLGEPCHGDSMRLGERESGACVSQAADWLTQNGAAYAAANPSCWGRIRHAAEADVGAIVVSPVGVGDRIKPKHAALVVVDGLHRALGYWLAGHRRCPAYVPVLPNPEA